MSEPNSKCPKCQTGTVVHGFRVGRATCSLCIDCGWCLVHAKYWPSVQRRGAR
jgi:hypothetical protein